MGAEFVPAQSPVGHCLLGKANLMVISNVVDGAPVEEKQLRHAEHGPVVVLHRHKLAERVLKEQHHPRRRGSSSGGPRLGRGNIDL